MVTKSTYKRAQEKESQLVTNSHKVTNVPSTLFSKLKPLVKFHIVTLFICDYCDPFSHIAYFVTKVVFTLHFTL